MKQLTSSLFTVLLLSASTSVHGQETEPPVFPPSLEEIAERTVQQAEELAEVQDELSADVMELVESQTVPQVVEMLEEVEEIMAEVTDDLVEGETGGTTLAAQTEIIEKILAAAKKKQQSSAESSPESQESMGAMLDMMERMMGREPSDQEGEQPGEGEGDKEGNTAGEGKTGESNTANENSSGKIGEEENVRIIPKGSAPSGADLPNEFRKLLDAYNRNEQSKR